MSEEDPMAKFVDAYNKITGEKLPEPVPESYFKLFPNALAKTPSAKASEAKTTSTTSKKEA